MKKIYFCLIAIIFCACGRASQSENSSDDMEEFRDSEATHSRSWKGAFNYDYETLEEAEDRLLTLMRGANNRSYYYDEFIDFISKEPATMQYPFTKIKDSTWIQIVDSEDKKLRCYSWDNGTGGTMFCYSNIYQYCGENGVHAIVSSIDDIQNEGTRNDIGESVVKIHTFHNREGKAIYLIETYNRLASSYSGQALNAVTIQNDSLVSYPMFKGKPNNNDYDTYSKEKENYLAVSYERTWDWYENANFGEGWTWMINYIPQTKLLYFAQTDGGEYGLLIDRYYVYHFDGEYFNYIGSDAGYWLHPTLRSYNRLMRTFEVKDYRVRVDKMMDGTYRYASWNNRGAMINEPDLVLYGGKYDEEKQIFTFQNNGYIYSVSNDGLIISHNGKNILHQEILEPKE